MDHHGVPPFAMPRFEAVVSAQQCVIAKGGTYQKHQRRIRAAFCFWLFV
jgi:hypothetical protein